MTARVSIPLQTTHLLAGSEERGYSTIKPQLQLIIPSHHRPSTAHITSDDDLIVTMDETSNKSSASWGYTSCPGTAHCEYCVEQGLDHSLQAYDQRKVGTTMNIYLWIYLNLLCFLWLIMLILLFRAYIYTQRLDQKYPGHPRQLFPALL